MILSQFQGFCECQPETPAPSPRDAGASPSLALAETGNIPLVAGAGGVPIES
ncbi:hypothetical protein [Kamptonema formosum]|uniref:hypothetical protein n=1 Tax=Kamptonema formosum TaxID=331992 RepID=UPI00034C414A|nr:hypothetical protein [Oscillatoria sp. PCC 10802]